MVGHCGYCGFYGELVFVHSHYQCPRCKNNILPCCEGENLDSDAEESESAPRDEVVKHPEDGYDFPHQR